MQSASQPAAPLAPVLPPPPQGVCRDGRNSDYETDIDCGGVCRPCAIERSCRGAADCASGLCKAGVCRERLHTAAEPVPPGYHLEPADQDRASTARWAGIGFFAVSYGAAYVAALSSPSSLSWLYVPLIGPWPLINDAEDFAPDGAVRITKVLLVTDGALQIAGALMWLGGALGRGEQLVRDTPESASAPRLWVAPTVTTEGYGIRVDALF